MKKNLLLAALVAVLVASIGFGQIGGGFPTITFVSPKDGATVKFPVKLAISLSDTNGLKGVEYTVGGTTIPANNWPPYDATWDNNTLGDWKDGSYRVEAKVFVGGGYTSSAISVTLKNQNVTPPPILLKPATPKNFVGVALSSSSISLTWEASLTAKGYNLKLAVEGKPIPTARLTTETSYTSSGLPVSSDVYCSLTAYNDAGESAPTAITVRTLDLIRPVKVVAVPEEYKTLQDGLDSVSNTFGTRAMSVINAKLHRSWINLETRLGKPVKVTIINRYPGVRGLELSGWYNTQIVLNNPEDEVVLVGFRIKTDWYGADTITVKGGSLVVLDSDVQGLGKFVNAVGAKLIHFERVNFIGPMQDDYITSIGIYAENMPLYGEMTGLRIFNCNFYQLSIAIHTRNSIGKARLSSDGSGDSNNYYGEGIKFIP